MLIIMLKIDLLGKGGFKRLYLSLGFPLKGEAFSRGKHEFS